MGCIHTETARALALFVDGAPPSGRELWVIENCFSRGFGQPEPAQEVICFTAGTMMCTGSMLRDVASLAPGGHVQIRDNGLKEVLRVGSQHLTGTRLHVMPELAPIRIGATALGAGSPEVELLVSAAHRVLVRGNRARALFNTDEVLVEARHLTEEHNVWVGRALARMTYVHVLLAHHDLLFSNGLGAESFHAADAKRSTDEAARGALDEAYNRRVLTPAEAAILAHAA